jgi:Holliday junction resolvase RusA-like endonuclease
MRGDMKYLQFEIQGKPVAAARPRVSLKGHAYLPKKTVMAKKAVAEIARHANQQRAPIETPVIIEIKFFFAPPKNLYKKRMSHVARPKKPDIDNLVKTVLDGITQAEVWKDDSLVVDMRAVKLYSNDNTDEKTTVSIWVGGEQACL